MLPALNVASNLGAGRGSRSSKTRARSASPAQTWITSSFFRPAMPRSQTLDAVGSGTQREIVIAEHACLKYSGRVGRSAAAKSFDEAAIRLAVIAHIRHAETEYDTLLARGCERHDARIRVEAEIARVLAHWQAPE